MKEVILQRKRYKLPLTEEQANKYIIDYCQCSCPIWLIGEQVQYTCEQYACWPIEEEEDEA